MKKICLCFLAFAVCGCCAQTAEGDWFHRLTSKPNCCNRRPVYYVNQPIVYAASPVQARVVKTGNLMPEIYDPNPLPPLKIYHSHKSRPHHFVAEYKQHETARPKTPERPQEPHKL